MSPEETMAVEFRDSKRDALDLRPSVYVLVAMDEADLGAQIVRARAEHMTSFMKPPIPAGTFQLDAGGLGVPEVQSPGTTRFNFTRNVHAELIVPDEDALLRLVRALRADLVRRGRSVPREAIVEFVLARQEAGDPEWAAVIGSGGNEAGPWGSEMRKRRQAQAAPDRRP